MVEGELPSIKSAYRMQFYILNGLIAPTISLLMVAVGAFVLAEPLAFERNYWFAAALCFLIALSLFVASFAALLKHRPISVTEYGISTSVFGVKFKEIDWSKVKRIERRRYTDPQRRIARFKYLVLGTPYKIWFDDGLLRLADIVSAINKHIQKNGIEAVSIDVGVDTRDTIKRTISDPTELEKALRDGVRTYISAL